ncbi:Alkaline phosphatase D precursor [compost metagenome]
MRMHVLDTRSYRSDQPCERPDERHCRPSGAPDVTMLGAAQEAWLAEGLRSGAGWNLIAQQVFVMPVRRRMPDGEVRMGAGDTWGGYPEARARLVKTITDLNLSNVVVASGDAHIHAVGTVPLRDDEPDGPAAAVEFLGTSIASGGDGAAETEGTRAMLAGSPHMKLVNAQRGYQIFDVAEREWRTDLKVLNRIQRPGGTLSKLASFTVERDRPMLG